MILASTILNHAMISLLSPGGFVVDDATWFILVGILDTEAYELEFITNTHRHSSPSSAVP